MKNYFLVEMYVNPEDLGFGSETYVKCYLESLGYKVIRGTQIYGRDVDIKGVPDFYVFVDEKTGFFCEVKLGYTDLSKEQEEWLENNPTENFRLVKLYRGCHMPRNFSNEQLLESKNYKIDKSLFQKLKKYEGI